MLRVGLVVSGLLLAGCAPSVPPAPLPTPSTPASDIDADFLRQVVEATIAAGGVRFAVTNSLQDTPLPADRPRIRGAYDFARQQGWYLSHAAPGGDEHTIVTLMVGRTRYSAVLDGRLTAPDITADPGPGWVKYENPDPQDVPATGSELGDPTSALVVLRDAAASARKVGTTLLRGVQATRYSVMLDSDRYAATLTSRARQLFQQYATRFTGPADVWVDADNRLRLLRYGMSVNLPTSTAGEVSGPTPARPAIELFDFGTPVQVTLPPADKVCGPSCPPAPSTTP